MIEVTDEMKKLVDDELGDIDSGYYHWSEYRDSTIKRIIELHEANKPHLVTQDAMTKEYL